MERVVGYCGIVCSDCPILIVTRREDDTARKRVAEMLTRHYGREYKPESINCDGCLSSSTHLWDNCRTCEVRKCARERNVENCASCPDYRCEKLPKLVVADTEGEDIWGEIRRVLG